MYLSLNRKTVRMAPVWIHSAAYTTDPAQAYKTEKLIFKNTSWIFINTDGLIGGAQILLLFSRDSNDSGEYDNVDDE